MAPAAGMEFLLRFYDRLGQQVILIEPLLEERNFLRHTVVGIARKLAERGIGCTIPDLPGCGESLLDIGEASLSVWRNAVSDLVASTAALTGGKPHIAALRGGTLIDDIAGTASSMRFRAPRRQRAASSLPSGPTPPERRG